MAIPAGGDGWLLSALPLPDRARVCVCVCLERHDELGCQPATNVASLYGRDHAARQDCVCDEALSLNDSFCLGYTYRSSQRESVSLPGLAWLCGSSSGNECNHGLGP